MINIWPGEDYELHNNGFLHPLTSMRNMEPSMTGEQTSLCAGPLSSIQRCLNPRDIPSVGSCLRRVPHSHAGEGSRILVCQIGRNLRRPILADISAGRSNVPGTRKGEENLHVLIFGGSRDPGVPCGIVKARSTASNPFVGSTGGVVVVLDENGVERLRAEGLVEMGVGMGALGRCGQEILLGAISGEKLAELLGQVVVIVEGALFNVKVESVDYSFTEGTVVGPSYMPVLVSIHAVTWAERMFRPFP
jgi:hypothetical protein